MCKRLQYFLDAAAQPASYYTDMATLNVKIYHIHVYKFSSNLNDLLVLRLVLSFFVCKLKMFMYWEVSYEVTWS